MIFMAYHDLMKCLLVCQFYTLKLCLWLYIMCVCVCMILEGDDIICTAVLFMRVVKTWKNIRAYKCYRKRREEFDFMVEE